MDLAAFETHIRGLVDDTTRPFTCNGSPFCCKVFIVGINPATEGVNIWDYWDAEKGMDFDNWFKAYKDERINQGKRLSVSPSRSNMKIITDELAMEGIKALETNIYSAPSKRLTDLDKNKRFTAAFEFLVSAIKPKLLLAHGAKTNKVINEMKNSLGPDLIIMPTQHLSYQFSKDNARKTAQNILKEFSLSDVSI